MYETVIGLEVHVELATKTKIFCSCPTEFGADANTQVCPVCLGMPGSLPALNGEAVRLAVMAGIALNCEIQNYTVFDRKNYFYPDLPKAYQISQLYRPVCQNGSLEIEADNKRKTIGIHEIHLEEDAGKLIHDPWNDLSSIDYNRCGVPLIEIVSEPDFRNGDEVVAYLEKLRETLLYLGISDCKMQEGSMRADINLSVRPFGQEEMGIRTEMKNMNSLKGIYRAIQYESKRQIEVIESGGRVIQQTRRWDDNKDKSIAMRTKENANDYRYFPDPDIQPVRLPLEWIEEIKKEMPESAEEKRKRFVNEYKLSKYDAEVLTADMEVCVLFEETADICKNPKEAANQITAWVMRLMKEDSSREDKRVKITSRQLADVIENILDGSINRTVAKDVIAEVFKTGVNPVEYIRANGLAMVNDDTLIQDAVDRVLKENPRSIEDYKNGKEKAFGFLVGQTMKTLKGKANPAKINEILKQRML